MGKNKVKSTVHCTTKGSAKGRAKKRNISDLSGGVNNRTVTKIARPSISNAESGKQSSSLNLNQINNNATLLTNRPLTRAKAKNIKVDLSKKFMGRNFNKFRDLNVPVAGAVDSDEEYEADRIRVHVGEDDESVFPEEYDTEEGEIEEEEQEDFTGAEGLLSNHDDDGRSVDTEVTFKRVINKEMNVDFSAVQEMPGFQNYIQKLVAKEVAAERERSSPPVKGNRGNKDGTVETFKSPLRGNVNVIGGNIVKSPSDTTIYAPALQRTPDRTRAVVNSLLSDKTDQATKRGEEGIDSNQIAQYIQEIRIQNDNDNMTLVGLDRQHNKQGGGDVRSGRMSNNTAADQPQPGTSGVAFSDDVAAAKDKADKLLIAAEKYKAAVNRPPGMYPNELGETFSEHLNVDNPVVEPVVVLDDDDFFHVTCHVDPTIKNKIAKGEYVDLERLLPKYRGSIAGPIDSDQKLNLVMKDGHAFFVPAGNFGNKINGIRKWEQAFRIYAAIYSQANPNRAAEIWQYVHVINVAAASFVWDNVSYYDVTFRQLMSQNPKRSWSKIYAQMWSLAMREPLAKNSTGTPIFGMNSHNQAGSSQSQNRKGYPSNQQKKKRVKYCWDFGRGTTCKDGTKCRYVHRCSYCDSSDHGKSACPKIT